MAQNGISGQNGSEYDLSSYFNKSVSAVQAHADEFERSFARPALATSQAFFDERPIAATFLGVFCILSFLPVASFLGVVAFAVISFFVAALSCAFLASAAVILSLLSLLLLSLVATFGSSVFLTSTALSAYAAYRLAYLLKTSGADGISYWISEMKDAILPRQPQPTRPAYIDNPYTDDHDHDVFVEDVRNGPVDVKQETDLSSELQSSTQNSHGALSEETKVEPED